MHYGISDPDMAKGGGSQHLGHVEHIRTRVINITCITRS